MERAIGEKFKINGCVYVVVRDASNEWEGSCSRCAMRGKICLWYRDIFGECDRTLRSDRKPVHFEHFGVDFDPTRHQHAF